MENDIKNETSFADELLALKQKIDEIRLSKDTEISNLKKSVSELEEVKNFKTDIDVLKSSVSKLENEYEPISGVASNVVENEKITNIHDYFKEYIKGKQQ